MRLTIEYCTAWGYLDRAVSLGQKILHDYKNQIAELTLLPSGGGVYEVTLNGEVIFSKRETGRFPEFEEIDAQLKRHAAAPA